MSFDDGGDLHRGTAPGTPKRMRFVNLLDERCAALAGFASARRTDANPGSCGCVRRRLKGGEKGASSVSVPSQDRFCPTQRRIRARLGFLW